MTAIQCPLCGHSYPTVDMAELLRHQEREHERPRRRGKDWV